MLRRRRWLGVGVLAMAVMGGAFVFFHYIETYHLLTVREGVLYRDGNRGIREFRTAVRRVRPKTVVMLVSDAEIALPDKPQFTQEMAHLKERGIRLVRIPMLWGTAPSTEQARSFLQIVEDPANQPVLVHCSQGMVRTGMMVAAYQESVLGWDDEKVEREMARFGRTGDAVRAIRDFIHRYDGPVRAVRPATAPAATAASHLE